MCQLFELLGAGLLSDLTAVFARQLPDARDEDPEELRARRGLAPTSLDLALRDGVACLHEGRLSEARAAFHEALRLSKTETGAVQAWIGLACVEDERGRADESLRMLARAETLDAEDPAIAFGIGFCQERAGDAEGAATAYRRAAQLCPRLRNAYERLAALAFRRQDLAEAARCYERIAAIEPQAVDVLTLLGGLYLASGRAAEAAEQFERALLIEPECTEPVIAETAALEESGRLDEALRKLGVLLEKYPGIADLHVHMGDLLARAGQDAAALEHYRAALELHPTYLEATVKLGTQHLRQGRRVEAAQHFNRAVDLNDRTMIAYVGLGVAQHEAGRVHEARATLDLVAGLDPNSTLLFAEASRLQREAEHGRRAGAARAGRARAAEPAPGPDPLAEQMERYRQALALHPNDADLYYRHGLLLRQVGEFDEAQRAFRNAAQIHPTGARSLMRLGLGLKESGDLDGALECFRRTLLPRMECVEPHYQLALLFTQRCRFDLAVEAYERQLQDSGLDVSFRANVALALQTIGMLDRAASTWRSICDLAREFDEHADARRALIPDAED